MSAAIDSCCIILKHVSSGKWFNGKTATSGSNDKFLPDDFLMDIEAHFGGCGGLVLSRTWNKTAKFAFGFSFGMFKCQYM